MKTLMITFCLVIGLSTITKAQETLPINTSKSSIKWSGEYSFYFGGHYGTIAFKDGFFIKTNGKISGGFFKIDMHSITTLDMENEEANLSLTNHLKDSDFFDVKHFPEATLKITHVTYHDKTRMKIHADLTIKGITLPIDFQAEVNYEMAQMTTKFKIDRIRWGITYNSPLRDGAISDAIGFEVKLSL